MGKLKAIFGIKRKSVSIGATESVEPIKSIGSSIEANGRSQVPSVTLMTVTSAHTQDLSSTKSCNLDLLLKETYPSSQSAKNTVFGSSLTSPSKMNSVYSDIALNKCGRKPMFGNNR
jgi:hypothetical protein